MAMTTHDVRGTPWERFETIRKRKGLMMGWIAEASGIERSHLWGMLNGKYGRPKTPEKVGALLRALNEGPGDPVSEADIWPDAEPEAEPGAEHY